jgi:hypothetical protein
MNPDTSPSMHTMKRKREEELMEPELGSTPTPEPSSAQGHQASTPAPTTPRTFQHEPASTSGHQASMSGHQASTSGHRASTSEARSAQGHAHAKLLSLLPQSSSDQLRTLSVCFLPPFDIETTDQCLRNTWRKNRTTVNYKAALYMIQEMLAGRYTRKWYLQPMAMPLCWECPFDAESRRILTSRRPPIPSRPSSLHTPRHDTAPMWTPEEFARWPVLSDSPPVDPPDTRSVAQVIREDFPPDEIGLLYILESEPIDHSHADTYLMQVQVLEAVRNS